MKKTILNPKGVHTAPSNYSHACIVEGKKLLFISGQIPIDASGNLVGPGDLRAQLTQVLENMKVVLEAAGASFSSIVQTMTFLRDEENIVQRFWEIRKEVLPPYFPDGVYPVSTLLVVPSLFRKEVLVEYQAVAVID